MKPYVIELSGKSVVGLHPCGDGAEVEATFIQLCRENIWNFDEYTAEDIEVILDNGFEEAGDYSVSIYWIKELKKDND